MVRLKRHLLFDAKFKERVKRLHRATDGAKYLTL